MQPRFGRTMVLTVAAVAATAAIAAVGGAQGRQSGSAGLPGYWIDLSYGFLQAGNFTDGKTNANWNFGYAAITGAALEKTLQGGSAIGVEMGFASPHLDYTGSQTSFFCTTTCTAKADVTQLIGRLRLGGARGTSGSSIVLNAGATEFANFKELSTGTALPGREWDPTLGIGYEFGANLAAQSTLFFGYSLLYVLPPQGQNASTSATHTFSLRVGFRQGF